jgi:hypothetical protein
MRWGTWSGSVTQQIDAKDFDVAFGGHGKHWDTTHTKETITVQGRVADINYSPFNPKPPESLTFAHSTGTDILEGTIDVRYVDGYLEHKDLSEHKDTHVRGSLDLSAGEYQFSTIGGPQGHACPGEPMNGNGQKEDGDPSSDFYTHRQWTWSFTFTPTGPPDHVRVMRNWANGEFPDIETPALDFAEKVRTAIEPAVTELNRERRYDEARRLQTSLDQTNDYLYNEASQEAGTHFQDASTAYNRADGDWMSDDPAESAQYTQKLQTLVTAINDWRGVKHEVELKYATAAERAATLAEPVRPDVAARLRQMATDLRDKGFEGVP